MSRLLLLFRHYYYHHRYFYFYNHDLCFYNHINPDPDEKITKSLAKIEQDEKCKREIKNEINTYQIILSKPYKKDIRPFLSSIF